MKKYLGLDLSTTATGIVVLDAAGVILRKQVVGYELTRQATSRDKIERLIDIAVRIVDTVRAESVTGEGEDEVEWQAAVEHYAFRQHGAVADLGEINGIVKVQLWLAFQIAAQTMVVSSARKLVLGKGNVKKGLVIPLLRERGIDFDDHNIADAYVIAEALRRRCEYGDEREQGKQRARRARKGRTSRGSRGARRDPQTSLGFT